MRIHGIHLQGIRAPRGEHRIAFDPGYNSVLASNPEDARALLCLLEALLYPTQFGEFASWVGPASHDNPRAGVSFSLGSGAYRVIADFQERRLVLGSYDAKAQSYERVSTDPAEIEEHLAQAGLAAHADFRLLLVRDAPPQSGGGGGAGAQAESAPGSAPRDAGAESRAERAALLVRARTLRDARDRVAQLEAAEKELAEVLDSSGPSDQLEDLEVRVERLRVYHRNSNGKGR